MSEFKIIKCKKCDAALVELLGHKITQCVQCGHQFNLAKNSANSALANLENKKNVSPELAKLVTKLKEIAKTKKPKIVTNKKNSNQFGIIVFVIVALYIFSGLFSL